MPRSFLNSRYGKQMRCSEIKSSRKIFSISDVIARPQELSRKSDEEHKSIFYDAFPDNHDVIASPSSSSSSLPSPPSSSSSSSSTIPSSPTLEDSGAAGWLTSRSTEGWRHVKKEAIDEGIVDAHLMSPSNQSEGRISAGSGSGGHSDVDPLENFKHFKNLCAFPFVLNSEQHWKEQTPPVIHCASQRGTSADNFPNFLHFWSHEKLACSPFFLPFQWFKANDGRVFYDHPRSHPPPMFNFLYPPTSPTKNQSFSPCIQPTSQPLTDSHACPDCGKRYSTSSNLARHRQSHKQAIGNSSSSSSSSDNVDKQSRKCPHCDKTYVSVPAFNMHVRTHNQGCVCPHCGKKFSRPWLLQGHLRTHTGEKPFRCSQCSKTFADKSNLRAHIQTHSTEKPFVCGRCKKAFALKSYLYKHEESSCMRSSKFFVGIA